MALMKEQQIDQVAELQKRIDAAVDQINAVIDRLESAREQALESGYDPHPFGDAMMQLNGSLDMLTEADDEPTCECPKCEGLGLLSMQMDVDWVFEVTCAWCHGFGVVGVDNSEDDEV